MKNLDAIYFAARELPPADRPDFLAQACAGDDELQKRVKQMLAVSAEAEAFITDLPDDISEARTSDNQSAKTLKLDLPDAPDEAVGQTLGRYKLLERVGEGGCGVVYVAEQTEPLRRRVALKVIKLGMDTKQVVARFEAERQALAMMDHANIAKVLDAGTTDLGRPYFVMELVRGIRITDYCDQANLTTRERLDLFIKVCQAIQHAHQKGIIHRDIKPSNILVTLHDGVPVPKVIDFGIAKATEGRLTDATVYTQLHQFIGTPAYISPEQAEMSGLDIDTRSDIYSLGVLLYELLAGSTPFDAKELMASGIDAMRKTIREKEPMCPSTRLATLGADQLTTEARRRSAETSKLLHQLQGDLDWIVMKCLEKDRTRRYDTANDLAADLKRHLSNEAVVARPPSSAYVFSKLVRRHKIAFAAVAAVTASLAIGLSTSTWLFFKEKAARTRAHEAEKTAIEKAAVADAAQLRANQGANELRRNLYAADMSSVSEAWEKSNISVIRNLLERHRPKPGEQDLRGFEWFYFLKVSQGEQKELVSCDIDERSESRLSPDGTLVMILTTNELQVFNWRTRRTVTKWSLPSADSMFRRSYGFTSDNKFAWTTEADGFHLFEINTRRERILPTGACNEAFISPIGHVVAVHLRTFELQHSSQPSPLRLWDYETGTELKSLAAADDDLLLSWSSDGTKIYTERFARGSGDSVDVSVWDVKSGERRSLDLPPLGGDVVSVSPDGQTLVQTNFRGELSIIDVRTQRMLASNNGFPLGQAGAKFSPDGQWFAAWGPDNQIIVWERRHWSKVATLRGHSSRVSDLHFLPENNRLLSLGRDSTIRIWELGSGGDSTALTHRLPIRVRSVEIQFSPDGRYVTLPVRTSETTSETVLWDTAKRVVKARFDGLAAGFSSDGKLLLLHTEGSHLQILEVESQLVRHEFQLEPTSGVIPQLSANAKFLAYRSWSHYYFRVYSASGEPAYSPEGRVRAWSFSPDSRLVALNDTSGVSDYYSTVLLKELTGPGERRVADCGAAGLAFSPNGHLLAAGTFPPGINLVDTAAGKVIASLKGHQTMVTCVVFSPDGRTLASGAQDRTIRLYNVETRRQVAVSQVSGAVLGLAFSPDGQTLVSCEAAEDTHPGHYRFWYAPRIDAPPLPIPALSAPETDSFWVTASKLAARSASKPDPASKLRQKPEALPKSQ